MKEQNGYPGRREGGGKVELCDKGQKLVICLTVLRDHPGTFLGTICGAGDPIGIT